jgi:ADP-ribosylglycohydrolase
VGTVDRVRGSLFGLAYGDALGKPTEFLALDQIIKRYGPAGPRELAGDPALVTDDTQMALAVAWALLDALAEVDLAAHASNRAAVDLTALTPGAVERSLRRRFVAWAEGPDNNRAAGNTCLRAVAGLAAGLPWQLASVPGSKGCGANMRVTPVGLLAGIEDDMLANLAQLQAGLTHGHPTALAAAELTAYAVCLLVRGEVGLAGLPRLLRDRAREQRNVYRAAWLGDLWRRSGADTAEEYIARGWDDCLDALGRLDAALPAADRDTDPCQQTGAGWIAEEALATALLCALLYAEEAPRIRPVDRVAALRTEAEGPVAGLARAARTSGDSDSIAGLTGALLGAAYGVEVWPADWAARIEYRDQLDSLSGALAGALS